MADMLNEDYTSFNFQEECSGENEIQLCIDLESVLTALHVEGAMVLLQFVGPRAIRLQFGVPAEGILAEAEVATVNRAAWWIRDRGVRYCPAFAQQHALWMGSEYQPATAKMREYGCTCPDTPDAKETGTYIVYEKCRIHGEQRPRLNRSFDYVRRQ